MSALHVFAMPPLNKPMESQRTIPKELLAIRFLWRKEPRGTPDIGFFVVLDFVKYVLNIEILYLYCDERRDIL